MSNAKDATIKVNHTFLLLGDPGTGKTSQILTLPGKKFVYLFDPNALISLRGHDIDYEEYLPDRLNMSVKSLSTKNPSDKTTSYKNTIFRDWELDFDKKIREGFFNDYDVVAIDSCTTFLDLIMDRTLTVNGRAGSWPTRDDWGPQMNSFTNVCRTLMTLNKTIVMTGHLDSYEDEKTKIIMRAPLLTGRLRMKIPLLFTNIFVCDVKRGSDGQLKHIVKTVREMQTTAIRNAFSIPLKPVEDVTIDWTKPPEGQGIGRLLIQEKKAIASSVKVVTTNPPVVTGFQRNQQ